MYVGANEIALVGRIAQLIVFLALAVLTIRDHFRGENGMTPGLIVISTGMILLNSLALFTSITSHPLSPPGFVPILWDNQTYLSVVDTWHAVSAVTVGAGAWMLAIYVYKAGRK